MKYSEIKKIKMHESARNQYLIVRAARILWDEGTRYIHLQMSDLDPECVVVTLQNGTQRLIHYKE